MARTIRQGDIYMCDLSVDSKDHEQSGVRPCLVVQTNTLNKTRPNVFVFPITHANKKQQPCHYILTQTDYPYFSFDKQIVLCEEGRSVSKTRLESFVGKISEKDMQEILDRKEYVFREYVRKEVE